MLTKTLPENGDLSMYCRMRKGFTDMVNVTRGGSLVYCPVDDSVAELVVLGEPSQTHL